MRSLHPPHARSSSLHRTRRIRRSTGLPSRQPTRNLIHLPLPPLLRHKPRLPPLCSPPPLLRPVLFPRPQPCLFLATIANALPSHAGLLPSSRPRNTLPRETNLPLSPLLTQHSLGETPAAKAKLRDQLAYPPTEARRSHTLKLHRSILDQIGTAAVTAPSAGDTAAAHRAAPPAAAVRTVAHLPPHTLRRERPVPATLRPPSVAHWNRLPTGTRTQKCASTLPPVWHPLRRHPQNAALNARGPTVAARSYRKLMRPLSLSRPRPPALLTSRFRRPRRRWRTRQQRRTCPVLWQYGPPANRPALSGQPL
jgi:hypothetical protein